MHRTDRARNVRSGKKGDAAGSSVVLAQFSTRLPPELLERLRIAAPQLGLLQSEITTAALHNFLKTEGF